MISENTAPGIAKVMGSNPVQALIFSGLIFTTA